MYQDIINTMHYSITSINLNDFLGLLWTVVQNPDFWQDMLYLIGVKIGFGLVLNALLK